MWKEGSNYSCLLYRGGKVTVDGIRRCVGALEDETVRLLRKLLFEKRYTIEVSKLRDEMGNIEPRFSLFTYANNIPILGDRNRLIRDILNDPQLSSRFVTHVHNGRPYWNHVSLSEWLQEYARLNLLCLVQVEMNLGAPPRTTEVTCLPIHNTPLGVTRALRIVDDHVVLMRVYHKMRSSQGRDRLIPHSLNACLAAVLIYVETILRPFASFCVLILFPENRNIHDLYRTTLFINYSRLFDGEEISKEMEAWTLKYMDIALNIRSWRQCATSFRRVFASLLETILNSQSETADSAQAGHSHVIDHLRYGVTERSALGLPEEYIGPFLRVSQRWHELIGLVPGLLKLLHSILSANSPLAGGQLLDLPQAIRTPEAPVPLPDVVPHSALPRPLISEASHIDINCIADAVVERINRQLSGLTETVDGLSRRMDQSCDTDGANYTTEQRISEWRPSFTSSSAHSSPNGMRCPRRGVAALPTAFPVPSDVRDAVPTFNKDTALYVLRRVLRIPSAQWTSSGQLEAVQALCEWKQDVIITLPTGSGKSIVLPTVASLESSSFITVVLCPLNSLLEDWHRRLDAIAYPHQVYDSVSPCITSQYSVVVASLDAAVTPAFQQAMASVSAPRSIRRIVIDEAHLVISDLHFRAVMQKVGHIRRSRLQFVLISATIPPSAESLLCQLTNVNYPHHAVIIREPSNRYELQFFLHATVEDCVEEVRGSRRLFFGWAS